MPPGRGTKRTGRRLPARSPKVGRPEPGVVGRRAWAAGPNGTQWRKEIALVWRCNSHVGRPAHPAGDIASSTEKEGFLEDRRHSAKVIGFRHGQVYRSRCYTPCRLHSQRRLQLRLTLMRAYPFQASKRPHPRRHGVSEGHRPLYGPDPAGDLGSRACGMPRRTSLDFLSRRAHAQRVRGLQTAAVSTQAHRYALGAERLGGSRRPGSSRVFAGSGVQLSCLSHSSNTVSTTA
jgi:hypothetical protein